MTQTLCDDDALRDLSKGVAYTYMSDVQGDIAEFGCFFGKSAEVLAGAMANCEAKRHGGPEPTLWLFDSFQGLPDSTLPPDTESPHVKSGAWTWKVQTGGNAPTPTAISQQCSAFLPVDRIRVIPGWYKDTLCKLPADTKLALVHIDCDLYESAYQVLDHLFDRNMLSDGCALFFDDWYCNRGSPKYGEQRCWTEIRTKHIGWNPEAITDWGPYGIVGRKFIVHR